MVAIMAAMAGVAMAVMAAVFTEADAVAAVMGAAAMAVAVMGAIRPLPSPPEWPLRLLQDHRLH